MKIRKIKNAKKLSFWVYKCIEAHSYKQGYQHGTQMKNVCSPFDIMPFHAFLMTTVLLKISTFELLHKDNSSSTSTAQSLSDNSHNSMCNLCCQGASNAYVTVKQAVIFALTIKIRPTLRRSFSFY